MRNLSLEDQFIKSIIDSIIGGAPSDEQVHLILLDDFSRMQAVMTRFMVDFALRDDGNGGKEKWDRESYMKRLRFHFNKRVDLELGKNAVHEECPGIELRMTIMMKVWFELCAQATSKLVKDCEVVTAEFIESKKRPTKCNPENEEKPKEDVINT